MADTQVEVIVDQEQNTQCPQCNEEFEDDQPQSELPCHHRYHTACFLQAMNAFPHDGINQRQCRLCQEPFGQINEEDTFMNQQIQRLRNQWDTNAEFRKDIKNFIKLQRNADKAQRELKLFVLGKKAERSDLLESLKQQLQAVCDLVKDDIKSSDTYKESRKAQMKASTTYRRLIEKHNIQDGRWLLRRALEGRPGLRRWPRSRYRYFGGELRYILRRMLNLRIKW